MTTPNKPDNTRAGRKLHPKAKNRVRDRGHQPDPNSTHPTTTSTTPSTRQARSTLPDSARPSATNPASGLILGSFPKTQSRRSLSHRRSSSRPAPGPAPASAPCQGPTGPDPLVGLTGRATLPARRGPGDCAPPRSGAPTRRSLVGERRTIDRNFLAAALLARSAPALLFGRRSARKRTTRLDRPDHPSSSVTLGIRVVQQRARRGEHARAASSSATNPGEQVARSLRGLMIALDHRSFETQPHLCPGFRNLGMTALTGPTVTALTGSTSVRS
jgi:hypothetical protein